MKQYYKLVALFLIFGLTACGGGSGSSNDTLKNTNESSTSVKSSELISSQQYESLKLINSLESGFTETLTLKPRVSNPGISISNVDKNSLVGLTDAKKQQRLDQIIFNKNLFYSQPSNNNNTDNSSVDYFFDQTRYSSPKSLNLSTLISNVNSTELSELKVYFGTDFISKDNKRIGTIYSDSYGSIQKTLQIFNPNVTNSIYTYQKQKNIDNSKAILSLYFNIFQPNSVLNIQPNENSIEVVGIEDYSYNIELGSPEQNCELVSDSKTVVIDNRMGMSTTNTKQRLKDCFLKGKLKNGGYYEASIPNQVIYDANSNHYIIQSGPLKINGKQIQLSCKKDVWKQEPSTDDVKYTKSEVYKNEYMKIVVLSNKSIKVLSESNNSLENCSYLDKK